MQKRGPQQQRPLWQLLVVPEEVSHDQGEQQQRQVEQQHVQDQQRDEEHGQEQHHEQQEQEQQSQEQKNEKQQKKDQQQEREQQQWGQRQQVGVVEGVEEQQHQQVLGGYGLGRSGHEGQQQQQREGQWQQQEGQQQQQRNEGQQQQDGRHSQGERQQQQEEEEDVEHQQQQQRHLLQVPIPVPLDAAGMGSMDMLVWIGYLKSYRQMGSARISCVGGCVCGHLLVDGFHAEKTSQTYLARLRVSQHENCRIAVQVLDHYTSTGHFKFKVSSVMLTKYVDYSLEGDFTDQVLMTAIENSKT
jgi:hypothetical protein